MALERLRISDSEVRLDGRTLHGIALRYGDIAPELNERFEPAAFNPVPRSIPLNLQHDPAMVIVAAARLHDSREALRVSAELPEGAAALSLVRRGALEGFSIEFRSRRERVENGTRVISEAALTGLALVDAGAYPDSLAEVRRRGGSKSWGNAGRNPVVKASWKANQRGACDCQGPECKSVSFEPGAFDEALNAPDAEMLALAGANRPIASLKKGSLAFRSRDNGDMEISISRLVATTAGGQSLIDEARATRVVARPWVRVEDSEYTESGGHRTFRRAALRGVIIKPTTADDGWDEIEVAGGTEPARRRARVWL